MTVLLKYFSLLVSVLLVLSTLIFSWLLGCCILHAQGPEDSGRLPIPTNVSMFKAITGVNLAAI